MYKALCREADVNLLNYRNNVTHYELKVPTLYRVSKCILLLLLVLPHNGVFSLHVIETGNMDAIMYESEWRPAWIVHYSYAIRAVMASSFRSWDLISRHHARDKLVCHLFLPVAVSPALYDPISRRQLTVISRSDVMFHSTLTVRTLTLAIKLTIPLKSKLMIYILYRSSLATLRRPPKRVAKQ